VNYLGHAAVATWRRPDPAFVLGAMLPDFAAMIGARAPATSHGDLEAGMRFHYRTDEVFHRSTAFVELTRSAFRWLTAHGMERGRARAIAHVGVELLLGAALYPAAPVRRAYVGALQGAAGPHLGRHLEWAAPEERLGFENLRVRLLARSLTLDDLAPEVTAQRLRRALSGRPRLALDDAAERVACDWVRVARPSVVAEAPALARELAERLGCAGGPGAG
jgi:hypothetical protein